MPDKTDNTLVFAFGSCSDEDKEQVLWDDILQDQPDMWIWLGDNIYGDTDNMDVMRKKYNLQKSNKLYQKMMQEMMITGTWDDHDFGLNDAGKNYTKRAESQKELLDFLDVPADDPRRSQEGVYGSHDVNHEYADVKIILLDARYFRDDLTKKDGKNIPNPDGEILGNDQWNWLEQVLAESQADIHIIASGIQVIPEQHVYEKWANFPTERNRLFELLAKHNTNRPIFISGDRHIGEISKMVHNGKVMYDITSSSLTHGWSIRNNEENKHRIGEIVYDLNYGIIDIRNNKGLEITGLLKSDQGIIKEKLLLQF